MSTLASCLLLAIAGSSAWLARANPDAYYLLLQEDGLVEWATVWAFVLAAAALARGAAREPELRQRWMPTALAIFCLFAAGEEISWGQRLFGYRPAEFFLARNFQQEVNLHNLASSDLREFVLAALLGGYGVVLPLALCAAPLARFAERIGVVAPALALAPAFAAACVCYLAYPLPFSGELVELALGLLLASVALTALGWRALRSGGAFAGVSALALACGLCAPARVPDPQRLADAERELAALASDFVATARERGHAPSGCDTHARLYSFVEEAPVPELRRLSFAALAEQGAERERIHFFLDPWNGAYWLRDECDERGSRSASLYSLGPNRRRDSTASAIGGDDVAVFLVRSEAAREGGGARPRSR